MAFSGTRFQRSGGRISSSGTGNPSNLATVGSEGWITEDALITISVSDRLGLRSRVCRVAISNPQNFKDNHYSLMHRVRVLDEFGLIIFSGRVVDIRPDFGRSELHVTCVDYLSDISDRTVVADEDGGQYGGVSRTHIVNQILYNETYRGGVNYFGINSVNFPVYMDHVRTLLSRLKTDPSNYIEKLTSKYATKDFWTDNSVSAGGLGALNPDTPFKYDYRGIKTGLEAIQDLASADNQQDLMVLGTVSDTYVRPDFGVDQEIYFTRHWKDFTADINEGEAAFIPLSNSAAYNMLYIGSNSKFNGVTYTFHQRGNSMEDSDYGTMYWQYWDGTAWQYFTPDDDSNFEAAPYDNQGSATWDHTRLYNWQRRDLAATKDLALNFGTGTNYVYDSSSNRDRYVSNINSSGVSVSGDQVESEGFDATMGVSAGTAHGLVDSTYRYWIRVGVASVTTRGRIASLKLYTDRSSLTVSQRGIKTLVRDFRATDAVFPDAIWKYVTPTDGDLDAGGTWSDEGATTSNVRVLWNDENSTTSTFCANRQEKWFLGTEEPHSGFELHAMQGSKLAISFIGTSTGNDIKITTEDVHGLTTGDYVLIAGSDCEPIIDNFAGNASPHLVTVINTTTFTISYAAVTVTESGESGIVVTGMPNYDVSLTWSYWDAVDGDWRLWTIGNAGTTATSNAHPSSGHGLDREDWAWDRGASGTTPHWYAEVRFDTRTLANPNTADNIKEDFGISTPMAHPGLNSGQDYRVSPFAGDDAEFLPQSTVAIASVSDVGSTTRLVTSSAHTLKVGDWVRLSATATTPKIDGIYEISAINQASGTNFDIRDLGVSSTGSVTCRGYTYPPNGKSLYWTKAEWVSSSAPTAPAQLSTIRTADQAHLKYYDRGKEPWKANRGTAGTFTATAAGRYGWDGTASSCQTPLDFFAWHDASTNKLESSSISTTAVSRLNINHNNSVTTLYLETSGGIYTQANADFPSSGSVELYDPTNGTNEIVSYTGRSSNTLTGVSRGRDGTTAVAHAANTIVSMHVKGKNQHTRYYAAHSFTVTDIAISSPVDTTATITVAHTMDPTGSYEVETFQLQAGDQVEFTGTDSTPTINATYTITDVLTPTETYTSKFTITHGANVTAVGGLGTCYVRDADGTPLFPTGQAVGDMAFFGAHEPFTQLRFQVNIGANLTGGSSAFAVAWEYFNYNYGWSTLPDLFDGTDGFKCAPNSFAEVHWSMPSNWRPGQPGMIDNTSSSSGVDHRGDWGAGQTGFYVRARITTDTSSVQTIYVQQILYGPNHWNNVTKDTGTITGVTDTRHASPQKYGLTFSSASLAGTNTMQMLGYSVGDRPSEFVNKVVVRGQAGAYGTAIDEESVSNFHMVREKNYYDTTITNSVQAEQRANRLLNALRPGGAASSIRECHISTQSWPLYSYNGHPQSVQVGDLVNIDIPLKRILNEAWLLASIEYDPLAAVCSMVLYRDLDRVIEAGTSDKKTLRDLTSRTRELARASFTTLDTVVEQGMDFLPEGPSRIVGRFSYDPVGTFDSVVTSGGGAREQADDYRWNFNLYSDYAAGKADRTQLRIDTTQVRPDIVADTTNLSQVDGAGLTLLGREQKSGGGNNNNAAQEGSGAGLNIEGDYLPVPNSAAEQTRRDHFYPEDKEATIYLRTHSSAANSTGAMMGNGLYVAHRGIFNYNDYGDDDNTSTSADGTRFPIDLHHELFVGVSGVARVFHNVSSGKVNLSKILPNLKDRPMVFLQADTSRNTGQAGCYAEVDSWITASVDGNTIYQGFRIAGLDPDGTPYSVTTGSGLNIMYLVVFNSARGGRYYGGQ